MQSMDWFHKEWPILLAAALGLSFWGWSLDSLGNVGASFEPVLLPVCPVIGQAIVMKFNYPFLIL